MPQNNDELPSDELSNDELVIKGMGRLRYASPDSALIAAYKSPYFWWWSFLRISKDYWWAVQREGRVNDERLRKMYFDFRDVYSQTFKDWWLERGVELFRERVSLPKVRVVNSLKPTLTKPVADYLVLEIPTHLTERTIIAQVRKQLRFLDSRVVKRQNKSRRPLAKLTGIRSSSFEMAFNVWRLFHQSRDGRVVTRVGQQLGSKSLYQIGKELQLVKNCMPVSGERKEISDRKINGMKVATSRMLKRAENLIANATLGEFPIVTAPKDALIWSRGVQEKLNQAVTEGKWRPLFDPEETLTSDS
jgi:hypothetical protein